MNIATDRGRVPEVVVLLIAAVVLTAISVVLTVTPLNGGNAGSVAFYSPSHQFTKYVVILTPMSGWTIAEKVVDFEPGVWGYILMTVNAIGLLAGFAVIGMHFIRDRLVLDPETLRYKSAFGYVDVIIPWDAVTAVYLDRRCVELHLPKNSSLLDWEEIHGLSRLASLDPGTVIFACDTSTLRASLSELHLALARFAAEKYRPGKRSLDVD